MDEQLKQNALEYHSLPRPGKISILPTKQLANQRDLALAHSPGVAIACEEPRAFSREGPASQSRARRRRSAPGTSRPDARRLPD